MIEGQNDIGGPQSPPPTRDNLDGSNNFHIKNLIPYLFCFHMLFRTSYVAWHNAYRAS